MKNKQRQEQVWTHNMQFLPTWTLADAIDSDAHTELTNVSERDPTRPWISSSAEYLGAQDTIGYDIRNTDATDSLRGALHVTQMFIDMQCHVVLGI